ncbi:dehydrogenase/reductase SDR family protein 7-like protein, partial [Leptotrombidium deliense]
LTVNLIKRRLLHCILVKTIKEQFVSPIHAQIIKLFDFMFTSIELAKLFWKEGCKVIIAARRIEQLKKVKNEIFLEKSENYFEPNILQLDLNDLQSIPSKVEEALKFHGCVDILVNNAGVSYRGTVLNTSALVDETIMKTNYFGHVVLTKLINELEFLLELLPQMLKRNCGDILVINSVQGKISIPFRSAYSASKHALTAFFDCLRAELANNNINVCVINPGYINTNLSVNALTGNGSKHGILDATTASGM